MDSRPMDNSRKMRERTDKPIPEIYKAIDNDLARDNLENDLPETDKADLRHAKPGASGEDF